MKIQTGLILWPNSQTRNKCYLWIYELSPKFLSCIYFYHECCQWSNNLFQECSGMVSALPGWSHLCSNDTNLLDCFSSFKCYCLAILSMFRCWERILNSSFGMNSLAEFWVNFLTFKWNYSWATGFFQHSWSAGSRWICPSALVRPPPAVLHPVLGQAQHRKDTDWQSEPRRDHQGG